MHNKVFCEEKIALDGNYDWINEIYVQFLLAVIYEGMKKTSFCSKGYC